ncbi:LacI family DNA-binding transcriptional regulator [Actinopolymorpha alba]|uniref:LacI family DNA-binding transcriptional regulator n=1 Tax=Actinopolymorpha alba TaxID=533267 RepID=UPI0003713C0B|nr:substrate-binding domain-containing protein [Actinopolymorpha alba]
MIRSAAVRLSPPRRTLQPVHAPPPRPSSLRATTMGVVGLVVHDVSSPIYADIIQGAQLATSQAGSVLMLVDADTLTDEAALRRLAADGRVDGLLWQVASHAGFDNRVTLAARHVPVVLTNSRPRDGLPGVYLDDEAAVDLAVNHLVELGHERIGFVAGAPGSDVSERRATAYRHALSEAGIRPRPGWEISCGWDPAGGAVAARELLRGFPSITAVLVTNALVAAGVVTGLGEAGRQVPDDISVVALHSLWFSGHLTPPLTVVRLPLAKLGREAAQLLLDERRPTRDTDLLIKDPMPELLVRGSTRRL